MFTYKNLPLERLIRCPIEWAEAFAMMDRQKRIREFMQLHEALPPSALRDARIARCMMRLGMVEQAKERLIMHGQEPLCVAWYVTACVVEGGEDQLRMVLSKFQPNWPMLDDTTRIEAWYRLHLARASAFATLRMKEASRTEFLHCLQYAEILQDKEARTIAHMEMARADTFLDDLGHAKRTYENTIQEISMNAPAYDVCQENLVGLSWITSHVPRNLGTWGKQLLDALWLKPAPVQPVEYPEDVETHHAATALSLLQQLTQVFNRHLPLFYSPESRLERQSLVDEILTLTKRKYADELTYFMVQTAGGLAETMMHEEKGITTVKEALMEPMNGVSIVVMAHFACLVQAYANLPHVKQDEHFINARKQLFKQFGFLPEGERGWLVWFMERFTPVSLFLLSEHQPDLQELKALRRRFLVVDAKKVKRGDGKTMPGYPRSFMLSHFRQFLAGERLPPDTSSYRVYAHRHKQFVMRSNDVFVVFRPHLDLLM